MFVSQQIEEQIYKNNFSNHDIYYEMCALIQQSLLKIKKMPHVSRKVTEEKYDINLLLQLNNVQDLQVYESSMAEQQRKKSIETKVNSSSSTEENLERMEKV